MSNGPDDPTADGWDVELSAETADRAEEILRELATEAELEMAVVVERSGGMIAGVATRQDVDVATVGALVAGAFGAMGALANELGEAKVRESLHQGSGDNIYLREIGERFVLLGVAPSSVPSGIMREKGAQVAENLTALFFGANDGASESDTAAETSEASVPPSAEDEESSPFRSATGPVAPVEPEQAPAETVHTEISVEDEHAVTMPSINPAVQGGSPPSEPEPSAPASPEPTRDEPGDKPTYVFEIG